MRIAFDVDGTLVNYKMPPNTSWYKKNAPPPAPSTWIIDMLKGLKNAGHYIIVWSGGGKEYAEVIVRQLNLTQYVDKVMSKYENDGTVDVCFDDGDVTLAKTNIRV